MRGLVKKQQQKIRFRFFPEILPGTEVPRATNAMALTESLRKMKQPKWPATSPITAVQTPIMAMEITKQGYPDPIPAKRSHCVRYLANS